jgi:hypothetical protein
MLFLTTKAVAYTVTKASHLRQVPHTTLNAWTLPKPISKKTFDSFTSSSFSASWYDDHNPTARKVVYNDLDQEEKYHFVLSFQSDDWIDQPSTLPHCKSEDKGRRPLKALAGTVYKRLQNLKYYR